MEVGSKLAIAGGSTLVVGGGGAGIYLTINNFSSEDSENNEEQLKKSKDDLEQIKVFTFQTKPNNTEDKIINRYWVLLTDPNNEQNIKWWNQAYLTLAKSKKNNTLNSRFTSVTEGFSSSKITALNKVCETIYSEEDFMFVRGTYHHNSKPNPFSSLNTSSLISDFWKYCSPLWEKPKTLFDAKEHETGDNDKINHVSEFSHILAATTTKDNNRFWELKNRWYLTIKDNNDSYQTKFNDFIKKTEVLKDLVNPSLKEICVYGQKISNLIASKEEQKGVLSRCSIFYYDFETLVENRHADRPEDSH